METNTPNNDITTGTIVQYRKVGTFRVIARTPGAPRADYVRPDGWYDLEPIKAPKKYREQGVGSYWIGPRDIVEAAPEVEVEETDEVTAEVAQAELDRRAANRKAKKTGGTRQEVEDTDAARAAFEMSAEALKGIIAA